MKRSPVTKAEIEFYVDGACKQEGFIGITKFSSYNVIISKGVSTKPDKNNIMRINLIHYGFTVYGSGEFYNKINSILNMHSMPEAEKYATKLCLSYVAMEGPNTTIKLLKKTRQIALIEGENRLREAIKNLLQLK